MLKVVIFSVLVILTSALPAAERDERQLIGFPLHMCPEVLCAQLTVGCSVPLQISTFQSGDLTCQGCPFCPDGASTSLESKKRQLFGLHLHMCPMVMCAQLDVGCSVPMEMSTYQYGNLTCQGCPFCPAGATTSLEAKKRQLLNGCPMLMCPMLAMMCINGLTTPTYTTAEGLVCRGCPTCALIDETTIGKKRQLIGLQLHMCPMVMCAQLDIGCSVPMEMSTFQHGDLTCQGCPFCPAGATTSLEAKKRQLLDGCPMLMCPMMMMMCMQGYAYTTPTYTTADGQVCRGCPHCAPIDETTVAAVSKKRQMLNGCPIMMCPMIMMMCIQGYTHTIPTYTTADGQVCKGCVTCAPIEQTTTTAAPVAKKRQLVSGCPVFSCVMMMCIRGYELFTPTYTTADGQVCRQCPHCVPIVETTDTTVAKKRQLVTGCPQVFCLAVMLFCQPGTVYSIHTHTTADGQICRGCPYCAPIEDTTTTTAAPVAKRQLVHILPVMCPQIMCLDVVLDCEQPETHTFTINGHTCYGCPSCPLGSTGVVAKREEETRSILPIRICPIVECAFLVDYQDCTEPLQQHTMTINGVVCPGCPYCPLSTSAVVKRDAASAIGIAFPVCPMVDCAFMLGWESCSTPLQQHTMIINGVECPGCPYCADNILVGAAVSKRQHVFPLCPVVDCFFPVNECSQPVKIGTISVGGHECPGCPYCPDDDTSTTAAP